MKNNNKLYLFIFCSFLPFILNAKFSFYPSLGSNRKFFAGYDASEFKIQIKGKLSESTDFVGKKNLPLIMYINSPLIEIDGTKELDENKLTELTEKSKLLILHFIEKYKSRYDNHNKVIFILNFNPEKIFLCKTGILGKKKYLTFFKESIDGLFAPKAVGKAPYGYIYCPTPASSL